MLSTLLQTQGGNGGASTWIILIVLLVVLVVMYIFSYIKRKKYNQEAIAMIDALKPGDKVKTYSGIYGTIVSIRETTDGKVVTLETGDGKHVSYVTVDTSVIYCIDKKQDIVRDANGEIIEPKDDAIESDAKSQDDGEPTEVKTADEVEETEVEDEAEQKKKASKKSDQEDLE